MNILLKLLLISITISSYAAQASLWGLKEVHIETTSPYQILTTTGAYTPVFSKSVDVLKGDYLVINGSNDFTEDWEVRTLVQANIFINGVGVGTNSWQNVSRGAGENHHMPITSEADTMLSKMQLYIFNLKQKLMNIHLYQLIYPILEI
jgi:hypothetical protein